ncbi:MAG: hypothetical protein FWH43_00530 [Endomicrobia bacterium]|nr:hypothetical protein [Endomicrobiia bacterium]
MKIFHDNCFYWPGALAEVFEQVEGDVKIFNFLKCYTMVKRLEQPLPDSKDKCMEELEVLKKDGYFMFAIDTYIHGGIALSFAGRGMQCRFDSGCAGYICIKGKDETEASAKAVVKGFIALFKQADIGEVYGYRVCDIACEEIDPCWDYLDRQAHGTRNKRQQPGTYR